MRSGRRTRGRSRPPTPRCRVAVCRSRAPCPPQSSASSALRSTDVMPDAVECPGDSARTDCARDAARPRGTRLRDLLRRIGLEASTKSVAPNCLASCSLSATVSTAMIRLAFESLSPWITLSPTPPTPNTAAVSPGWTLARLRTAPTPVSTPQPMRHAEVKGTSSRDLHRLDLGDDSPLDEDRRGREIRCRLARVLEGGRHVAEAADAPGRVPGGAGPAAPATGQGRDHDVVAGRDLVTPGPTASTMPAPSWPRTDGGFQGIVPSITDRSEWHTPAAWTATSTSPRPGSLTVSWSVTSASLPVKTMPRIFCSTSCRRGLRGCGVIGCQLPELGLQYLAARIERKCFDDPHLRAEPCNWPWRLWPMR